MRDIKTLLLESLDLEEAKHERKEADDLQFKVSCTMSNFPYGEYKGKEDDAVKLIVETIVKYLAEVFPEYKDKIEVNSKRILLQGLSRMFKQYIPIKAKAEEMWHSNNGFSTEEFKIAQQEEKMREYMIKSVINYIEKIYQFANKEAEKDGKKVSESFEEFCENIFEARANEIAWLLTFEDFKDYLAGSHTLFLLRHAGLDKVIDKKDADSFSSALKKVNDADEDFYNFRRLVRKNNPDWRKEPQYDKKEWEQKSKAYDDSLKNLYKLMCKLTDKYDADYPEEYN